MRFWGVAEARRFSVDLAGVTPHRPKIQPPPVDFLGVLSLEVLELCVMDEEIDRVSVLRGAKPLARR